MTSVAKWQEKIRQLEGAYDSASHNGSFRGQVTISAELTLAREALSDLEALGGAVTTLTIRAGHAEAEWKAAEEKLGDAQVRLLDAQGALVRADAGIEAALKAIEPIAMMVDGVELPETVVLARFGDEDLTLGHLYAIRRLFEGEK